MSRTARRRSAAPSMPAAPPPEPLLDGGAWWAINSEPETFPPPGGPPPNGRDHPPAGPVPDRTLIALPAGPPPQSAFALEVQAIRDEGARIILRAAGRAVLSDQTGAGSSQSWSELLAFRLSEWHKLADQLHQLCRWDPDPRAVADQG